MCMCTSLKSLPPGEASNIEMLDHSREGKRSDLGVEALVGYGAWYGTMPNGIDGDPVHR